MFLLYKNPDTPLRAIRNSLPLVNFKNQKDECMTANENNNLRKRRTPGRPKKKISRSTILMVRLTPTERLLIESRAKNAGLKPSEWFRRAAKSARVFPRFTSEESGWFRMLAGLANNLNQLTHQAHVAGLFTLALKCRSILKQVEELLTKLSDYDG
ncbi:plasmid mobilization relaxosome protein MobC [Pedobacter sp. HMF7647]|uniref:Plasmid mobilization relaxosome protein MobC n=1 Tax=Hufsiella arboris TaxID=2695275 RepID=A0A7K1YDK3_9SPHI|nr:plasmid mobilization relaxosome protein MobC [Hufsiella arboris]MXV52677.1 plasmid mobilization relaxosome protein MobC [Hufsiella arboris]